MIGSAFVNTTLEAFNAGAAGEIRGRLATQVCRLIGGGLSA